MLWWKDREECCLCECTDCAAACRDCSEAAAAASTVGRQQTVSGAEPGGTHTPLTPHSSTSHYGEVSPPPATTRKERPPAPRLEEVTGEMWSYLSTFLWLELQLAGGRSGSDQASHPARLLWISWPEQAQTLQDSDRRLDWALLSSLTSHVTVNLWKFPPKQTEIINNTLLDRPLYIVWQTSGCKNLALSHWEMQFNGY